MKTKFIKILFFIFSLLFQLTALSDVIQRSVNNLTLLLWILSLFLLYLSFPFSKKEDTDQDKKIFTRGKLKNYFLLFSIIVLALTIRIILMQNASSFHNDEYLSAYFSYSLPDFSKLDWFSIYPVPRDWIWQFPVLYFFFQKLFFNIFGIGTLTMRLSIVPYIIIIFTFLFLIVKRLYTKEAAYLTLVILAVFSPDLYLSRWSLHFISSTAFFLAATYFFILSVKEGRKKHFALLGFFLGLCYMVYYSSYLAVPLLFFYALALIIKKRICISTLKNFLLTVLVFIYTISPLATYAMKVENFLINRVEQVKLINGSWSPYKDLQINSMPTFEILKKQTVLSVKSLYTDGIGGHGGYVFGNLALFDKITFLFILLGILYFLFKIVKKRDVNSLFLLMSIFAAFTTGMIFTTPPPAFHRISLIFPFLALIISVTVIEVYFLIVRKYKKLALIFLVLCIVALVTSNTVHFRKVLAKDGPDDPDYPKIQQYLNQQNKKMFYVAAFDSYGLGKILFIRSGGKLNSITKQLDEILLIIPKDKTSYLVIYRPDEESIPKVKKIFPKVKVIEYYNTHILLRVN